MVSLIRRGGPLTIRDIADDVLVEKVVTETVDGRKRVMDIEKESLLLMCEALEAIRTLARHAPDDPLTLVHVSLLASRGLNRRVAWCRLRARMDDKQKLAILVGGGDLHRECADSRIGVAQLLTGRAGARLRAAVTVPSAV